jgi:phosphatidylglycerol:prolipoprotein diacylglycerol transferase
MHPEVFRLPLLNAPIYAYGLMMVVAFLATQWLSARLGKRLGYDPEIFVNATLIALVTGVIGCRISHVLENLPQYTRSDLSVWQNLFNMINIRSGGLTFYGGLILAFPAVLGYFVYRKVPGRVGMDIGAPCIMLGLAIGRIGCFLNGCCYGATCDVSHIPWAVRFPYYSNAYVEQFYGTTGASERLRHTVPAPLTRRLEDGTLELLAPAQLAGDPQLLALAATEKSNYVHPSQLYSTFSSLLIMAVLLCYFTMRHVPGRVFALMLILEGPTRFLLELLRVEPPVITPLGLPMSLSMVLGLVLFAMGVVLWVTLGLANRRRLAPFYAAVAFGGAV